jgi:hypothetical protein
MSGNEIGFHFHHKAISLKTKDNGKAPTGAVEYSLGPSRVSQLPSGVRELF